jgi:hypothetical protein
MLGSLSNVVAERKREIFSNGKSDAVLKVMAAKKV